MAMIRRRDLLKTAAAVTIASGLAPRIGQAESSKPYGMSGSQI